MRTTSKHSPASLPVKNLLLIMVAGLMTSTAILASGLAAHTNSQSKSLAIVNHQLVSIDYGYQSQPRPSLFAQKASRLRRSFADTGPPVAAISIRRLLY